MESSPEQRDPTPPLKRQKTDSDKTESDPPSRERSVADKDNDTRRDDNDERATRDSRAVSRTPTDRGSGQRRYSSGTGRSSRARSRSRSRTRRRESSGSRSRSRSASRSASRSSRPRRYDSRSRSRSRSRSNLEDSKIQTPDLYPPLEPTPIRPDETIPAYKAKLVLRGHEGPVSQVRISPNGKFIASASADATCKIWDAETGSHMDTLVGHMAGVGCIAWSPDSTTLASGSDDKAIRLWDRVTGRPKTTTRKNVTGQEMEPLRGHHNYVHCMAFSPKGNILASGSYDEALFLWDVRAGRLMRQLPAHSDPVSGIDFSCDGTLVVSCSTDGLTRVWDTQTGQCLRTLVHEDNPAVTNVCFSPNSRFVLAFNLDNCLRLWDYVAGSVKKTYQGHKNEKFSIGGCFVVLDGQAFIASPSETGGIVLWDVKSKEVVQRIDGHPKDVCFWVDVCGDTMASAGQDCTVRVYRHQRPTENMNGKAEEVNGQTEDIKMNGLHLEAELPIRVEDVRMEDA